MLNDVEPQDEEKTGLVHKNGWLDVTRLLWLYRFHYVERVDIVIKWKYKLIDISWYKYGKGTLWQTNIAMEYPHVQ